MQQDSIIIRELTTLDELHRAETLQQEVWGCPDLEVVHAQEMLAVREAGGTVIGAFDGAALIGFVYGFVGWEERQVTIHSHLAAVKQEYRSFNVGYRLKLAQREHALASGIRRITWTFDPLQSLNAHFNFAKLGVTAAKYKVNFYGAETAILVPGIGTDRFWVDWRLDSARVVQRLTGATDDLSACLREAVSLVRFGEDGAPSRNEAVNEWRDLRYALIDIPADIGAVQRQAAQTAAAWRETTRWAFTEACRAGATVTEFIRQRKKPAGTYLLCFPSA